MIKFFSKKLTYLFLFICALSQINADGSPLLNPTTQEEALFLRRIAEFWQDGEMEIAKYQIENYINDNPSSSLIDSLYALLGNIYMNEKNYSKAIASFDNIQSEDIKDKIAINLLAGLYHLKWYARLIDECESYMDKVDEELKQKITYLQALSLYNRSLQINEDQQQSELISKAKNKFENLLESQFENQAREYLSQIHKNQNDFEKASKYYLDLAKKDSQKREEYLFQAALLQAHFDKELALQTFNQITELSSNKPNDAAYNKLLLLFEMQRYESIIAEKDKLLQMVPQGKEALANFFIGRSFFNLNDYENACTSLEKILLMEDQNSMQIKLALIMLMQSSFHLNKFDLFIDAFEEFIAKFPNDDQLFETLFAKALMSKNNEKYEEAKKDFEKIQDSFESSTDNDKFLFEYAHLLFLMNDTAESKIKFQKFIEKYPTHEFIKVSHTYIVNCSIKELQKQNSEEDFKEKRRTLVTDIEDLLIKQDLFTKQEKAQYRYLLAKTHFDLENYELSLNILQNLLKDNANEATEHNKTLITSEELSEITLLMGFCHKNLNNDLNEFIHFAESALEITSNSKHQFATYINLFNCYLILAKEKEAIDEEQLLKAAEYLYKAYEISPKEINKNNLLWLSNFYSNKVRSFMDKSYKNKLAENVSLSLFSKNSIALLKDLVKHEDESFEENSIKLAYQHVYQNNFLEAKAVLEKLVQNYRFSPEKQYNFLEEAIFLLANIYEKQNEQSKAVELYQEFLTIYKKDSRFKSSSMLHLARLQLSQTPKDNFVISNKDLEKIISTLKTISLQRTLENEPTHLEAALDYVDVVCYMEKKTNWEKRLFLLGRLKESFYSEDDVLAQDYKALRDILKEKDKLFTSYMNVVDAEKFISLGYLENDKQHFIKAKEILNNLNEKDLVLTKYLETRIAKNLKLIEDSRFEEN